MVEPGAGGASSWDSYWKGATAAGARHRGGVSHPAVRAFWEEQLSRAASDYDAPRVLDLATGDGALAEQAEKAFGGRADVYCLDASAAALAGVRERLPGVRQVAADAGATPFARSSFDLVCSQFGVEYAGEEAVIAATELLSPGGRLVLLLHRRDGIIHRECTEDLQALARLRASRFVPLALEMFRGGFQACRGGDRAPYEQAAARLQEAVHEAGAILAEYGRNVCSGTIAYLYGHVARIHQNIDRHDPQDVLPWLERVEVELDVFSHRLAGMQRCALDEAQFAGLCSELRQRNLEILRAEALAAGHDDSVAWVLMAGRTEQPDGARNDIEAPALRDWAKERLDQALQELMARGVIDDPVFEAKPAWALSRQIVIGRVRKPFSTADRLWVICGNLPTDAVTATVAAVPREAARHFALKWQLDAERAGSVQAAEALIEAAETLYSLVKSDRFWP